MCKCLPHIFVVIKKTMLYFYHISAITLTKGCIDLWWSSWLRFGTRDCGIQMKRQSHNFSPDSCLICMVGLDTDTVLVVWGEEERGDADRPLGETDCCCCCCCCLGNWRIWEGEPTRALGEGILAVATFTAAVEPAEPKVYTHTQTHREVIRQKIVHRIPSAQ